MRPSAQPLLWKWILLAWEWKNISISKAERLFWYRGPGELGNGLLGRGDILWKRENPGVEITHDLTPDTFF